MTETSAWDTLRMIRLHGKKPESMVIVTTNAELPARMRGVGALVIHHKPGEVMPVKLLEGLDVILMLGTCGLASTVWKLCKTRGVKLASCRTWCNCAGLTTVAPMSCESYADAIEWLEKSA